MKTIYVVLDNVAVGPMEIDESADLLSEVQKQYPEARRAEPYENLTIASTKPLVIMVSTK